VAKKRFQKFDGTKAVSGERMARQRLGLRQPSAALGSRRAFESGRGLPQSKTSRNHPAGFQSAATVFAKPLLKGLGGPIINHR
jgi:hypothetical protein